MYHRFFIQSSNDGCLACFHGLAIVNSAAMNIALAGKQWRHRHRKHSYGHFGWGQARERGMYGESNMEAHITICKIDN